MTNEKINYEDMCESCQKSYRIQHSTPAVDDYLIVCMHEPTDNASNTKKNEVWKLKAQEKPTQEGMYVVLIGTDYGPGSTLRSTIEPAYKIYNLESGWLSVDDNQTIVYWIELPYKKITRK